MKSVCPGHSLNCNVALQYAAVTRMQPLHSDTVIVHPCSLHGPSRAMVLAQVRSMEAALASPSIPPEIVTTLLNLAEFMEHDDKTLPLDARRAGRACTAVLLATAVPCRCHAAQHIILACMAVRKCQRL